MCKKNERNFKSTLMKTTINKLIEIIEELKNRGIELTSDELLTILKQSELEEKEQILDAFNEGMRYGNSPLQTFDYPASRYYMFTYDMDK